MMGKRAPGTCVVLMYHAIPANQRERFARQMDLVRRFATPLRADSQVLLEASRNYIALTFDDGLSSFAENALPELEKRDIPVALFVVAGKPGTIPAWASYSSDAIPMERMLSEEQLRNLSRKVLVGSHSFTHSMLTKLDSAEARYEIQESRRKLESILGHKVTLFSFPYGAFTDELVAYCKAAGYERVFTIVPVLAFSDPREFVSGRIHVDPTDWCLEFRLKIAGAYRWLPYAFEAKRTLSRVLVLSWRKTQKVETR
jgi:peptidoglycan/xylan/chitin deacetylase (PgdA/CDA1 family)